MKLSLLASLLCGILACAGSSEANTSQVNTYSGTIDAEVTSISPNIVSSPWFIGEQLHGWYSYISPSIDGTFSGNPLQLEVTLYGSMATGLRFAQWSFNFIGNSQSTLTVNGGVVTYMDVDGETGPINFYLFNDHFFISTEEGPALDYYSCSGTVDVSAPHVPESCSFLINGALGVPFVSYLFLRRRRRKFVWPCFGNSMTVGSVVFNSLAISSFGRG